MTGRETFPPRQNFIKYTVCVNPTIMPVSILIMMISSKLPLRYYLFVTVLPLRSNSIVFTPLLAIQALHKLLVTNLYLVLQDTGIVLIQEYFLSRKWFKNLYMELSHQFIFSLFFFLLNRNDCFQHGDLILLSEVSPLNIEN